MFTLFNLVVRIGLLSIAPAVRETRGQLRARTNLLWQLLSLFSYRREVVVDRKSRYVSIATRRLWFLADDRAIPFRSIERIDYGFKSMPTSIGRGIDGAGVSDNIETFSVSLVLNPEADETRGEIVELFAFRGDGSGEVPTFNEAINFEGAQEEESLAFVRALQRHVGVGLSKATPRLEDDAGRRWACTDCGRPGPPRERPCYYCGGEVRPEVA